MEKILAIDPGRDKCGVAILDGQGEIILREVIATDKLEEVVRELWQREEPERLVMGDGTTSGQAVAQLKKFLPELTVETVDEYRTTDEAKLLYWQLNPPAGLKKFLPVTMLTPPGPVDDLAAVVLGRRFLRGKYSLRSKKAL